MGHVDFIGDIEIPFFQEPLTDPVAQDDDRGKETACPINEAAHTFQTFFGLLQADGLGNEFAEDPEQQARCDDGHGVKDEDRPKGQNLQQWRPQTVKHIEQQGAANHCRCCHAELCHAEKLCRITVEFQ